MKLLISACLLGTACRYDGQSKMNPLAQELLEKHTVIPVCPEVFGGLPIPRVPAEHRGETVITAEGKDVTEAYRRGAEEVLRLARLFGCEAAVLKERSPACGSGKIYDGTFSGTLTDGWGVAAARLREEGIRVLGESDIASLLQEVE